MPDETFFSALENSSLNKQHGFFAQHQEEFESVPVTLEGKRVEKGDHLRWTGAGMSYCHHVVCTGVDGKNITFAEYTGPASGPSAVSQSVSSSDSGRLGRIRQTTISFSDLKEKNAELIVWPKCLRRFSRDKIVERANQRLGENYYSIVKNNCEHFVTWCICGLRVSLQVKSWHIAMKEFLCSMMNTKTAAVIAANVADEVKKIADMISAYVPDKLTSLLRKYNPVLVFDAVIEAGIAVHELYKFYQEYKEGKYCSWKDVVKQILWILAKAALRLLLVYIGWTFLKFLVPGRDSDIGGGVVELRMAIYEIEKAWDQWKDGVLIRNGWDFTVKVVEILTKAFFRFGLGYLGSKYSGEIFEYIGAYLPSLSKLTQSLVCGAAGASLGHLAGVVTTWVVENYEYIFNSG